MWKTLRYLNKKRHEHYMGAKLFKLFITRHFYRPNCLTRLYLPLMNSLTPTIHQLFITFLIFTAPERTLECAN